VFAIVEPPFTNQEGGLHNKTTTMLLIALDLQPSEYAATDGATGRSGRSPSGPNMHALDDRQKSDSARLVLALLAS
jgi:hypothetical protein